MDFPIMVVDDLPSGVLVMAADRENYVVLVNVCVDNMVEALAADEDQRYMETNNETT